MDKISFENGVTKASAETMNTLQNNVESAIAEVANGLVLKGYGFTTGVLQKGASGFLTVDVEMMNGYMVVGMFVYTGQIGASNGLQLTPVYVNPTSSVGYVNYYAPNGISSMDFTLNVLYKKEVVDGE